MRAIRSSRHNKDKERRRKRKQRRGRIKRRIMEEYRKSSVMMEGKGFCDRDGEIYDSTALL